MSDDQIATPEGRGAVIEPIISGLPKGYVYGVARYADVILQQALTERLANLVAALRRVPAGEDPLIALLPVPRDDPDRGLDVPARKRVDQIVVFVRRSRRDDRPSEMDDLQATELRLQAQEDLDEFRVARRID